LFEEKTRAFAKPWRLIFFVLPFFPVLPPQWKFLKKGTDVIKSTITRRWLDLNKMMLHQHLYCDVETTLKLNCQVDVIQSTIIGRWLDVNKVMLNQHLYRDVDTTLKLRCHVDVIQSTIINVESMSVKWCWINICIVMLKQRWNYVVMLTSSNQPL
jgi:hypothetical protein